MSRKVFEGLVQSIQEADAKDFQQLQGIHRRICSMRDILTVGVDADMSACLDAAALLVECLPYRKDVDATRFLAAVGRLISAVESGLSVKDASELGEKVESSCGRVEEMEQGRRDLQVMNQMLLGEVLLQFGEITEDQLEQALEIQRDQGGRLGAALISIGAATEQSIENAVNLQAHLRGSSSVTHSRLEQPDEYTLPDEGPLTSVKLDDTCGLEYITDTLLGEIMVTMGSITREQLVKALEVQNELGCRLGDALCELGFTTWNDVHRGLKLQVAARRRDAEEAGS